MDGELKQTQEKNIGQSVTRRTKDKVAFDFWSHATQYSISCHFFSDTASRCHFHYSLSLAITFSFFPTQDQMRYFPPFPLSASLAIAHLLNLKAFSSSSSLLNFFLFFFFKFCWGKKKNCLIRILLNGHMRV